MIRKLLRLCIAIAVLVFLAGCLQGQVLRFSDRESVRLPERIAEQNGTEESSEMVPDHTEEHKTIPGSMPAVILPVSLDLILPRKEELRIVYALLDLAMLFLMSGCISRELVPRTSFFLK